MAEALADKTSDVARRLLILNYKLGCWYALAEVDPDSDETALAAGLADLEARQLLVAIQRTLHYRT